MEDCVVERPITYSNLWLRLWLLCKSSQIKERDLALASAVFLGEDSVLQVCLAYCRI